MPLKDFHCSITSALTLAGKTTTKTRGRPSSLNDETPCSLQSKKIKTIFPLADVRYDTMPTGQFTIKEEWDTDIAQLALFVCDV